VNFDFSQSALSATAGSKRLFGPDMALRVTPRSSQYPEKDHRNKSKNTN